MATDHLSPHGSDARSTYLVDMPADAVRLNVNLDITSTCNLHCIHCWMNVVRDQGYRFKNDMMPVELFTKILSQLEGRIDQLSLSCGYEPLLNTRLFDYLDVIKQHPPTSVNMYTNGVLLTQEKLDRLLDAGLSRLTISMDGAAKESFERIRKGAKWEKFLEVLAMIRDTKRVRGIDLDLRFNWTLMRSTALELCALVRLAEEFGFNQILSQHLLRYEGWNPDGLHDDALYWSQDSEVISSKREAHELAVELGIDFPELVEVGKKRVTKWATFRAWLEGTPRDQPLCTQPWTTMRISPNGAIHPCDGWFVDGVVGDWSKQDWEEIWNGETYRRLREAHWRGQKPFDCCKECTVWAPNLKRETRDRILPLDTAELLERGWFTGVDARNGNG